MDADGETPFTYPDEFDAHGDFQQGYRRSSLLHLKAAAFKEKKTHTTAKRQRRRPSALFRTHILGCQPFTGFKTNDRTQALQFILRDLYKKTESNCRRHESFPGSVVSGRILESEMEIRAVRLHHTYR